MSQFDKQYFAFDVTMWRLLHREILHLSPEFVSLSTWPRNCNQGTARIKALPVNGQKILLK